MRLHLLNPDSYRDLNGNLCFGVVVGILAKDIVQIVSGLNFGKSLARDIPICYNKIISQGGGS